MQEILDTTARTYQDSHAREDIEKSKLIPSDECNKSFVDSFTGDHKLRNFKEKL